MNAGLIDCDRRYCRLPRIRMNVLFRSHLQLVAVGIVLTNYLLTKRSEFPESWNSGAPESPTCSSEALP